MDIIIEYKPQRWFYIGAAISLITLIACIYYLIYDYAKNRNKKPMPDYKGHPYTEAMLELHEKGKIDKVELKEYLNREYQEHEVKHIMKDHLQKKKPHEKS